MRNRITHLLVLSFMVITFQNCAPSDSSSSAEKTSAVSGQELPPPPTEPIQQGQQPTPAPFPATEKYCNQDTACRNTCNTVFTYTSADAIRNAYAVNYGRNSGFVLMKIALNELAMQNNLKCLSLPISEVNDFIARPLTLEDISPIQVSSTVTWCFKGSEVVSCN